MSMTYRQGCIIILDKEVKKGPWVPAIISTKEPKWDWINIDNVEHARTKTLHTQNGQHAAIFGTEADAEKFRLVYPELCKESRIAEIRMLL